MWGAIEWCADVRARQWVVVYACLRWLKSIYYFLYYPWRESRAIKIKTMIIRMAVTEWLPDWPSTVLLGGHLENIQPFGGWMLKWTSGGWKSPFWILSALQKLAKFLVDVQCYWVVSVPAYEFDSGLMYLTHHKTMLVKVLVELHFALTLLLIKIARSWVGMMFTPQSFILSGCWKSPCLPLCLLARGKFLLKILWDQTAQQRNPRQTNFTHYAFIFLFALYSYFILVHGLASKLISSTYDLPHNFVV